MAESNDTGEKSVFEEETKHRTFKIFVEDKIFFVNPSFLAERSPFFETLLFGDFKEKKEGKAELKDVKAKDFEEFLLVLGADAKQRKKIDASNFVVLANFSHLWDMDILREECIMFIESEYGFVVTDVKTAIDIASACDRIQVPTSLLKIVASKLAHFPVVELLAHDAHNMLEPRMCTAAMVGRDIRELDGDYDGLNLPSPICFRRHLCMHSGCKDTADGEPLAKKIHVCSSHRPHILAVYRHGEGNVKIRVMNEKLVDHRLFSSEQNTEMQRDMSQEDILGNMKTVYL